MLRVATEADWRAVTGCEPPAHWIGLVCEEGGAVLGLGGLFEAGDGRWWATVQSGARRPLALWKAARDVLATAGNAGVTVHALADDSIEGARAFLDRVGFRESGEIIRGHRVLTWTL